MVEASDVKVRPNVLVVDDCEELCQSMARIFKGSGITAQFETDGQRAMEVLCEKQFDLMITDICMPKIAGDVLVRCVGQLRPDLPCIVITGLSERETLATIGQAANVVAVMTKPINSQRLAAVIHGFCRSDAATRANVGYWRDLLGCVR